MSEFENNNQYNQQENANPYQQENGTNGYSNPYYGNPSSAEEANSSNESSYYDKNAYGIVNNYGGYDKVPVKSGKGYAVASLILGISSITICCCVPGVGFVCALLAIIFGIISQKRNPCGMALAGIITAAFGLVFGVKSIKTFIKAKKDGRKKPIPTLVLGIFATYQSVVAIFSFFELICVFILIALI